MKVEVTGERVGLIVLWVVCMVVLLLATYYQGMARHWYEFIEHGIEQGVVIHHPQNGKLMYAPDNTNNGENDGK